MEKSQSLFTFYHLNEVVSFGLWLLQEPVIPDKSLHISFLSHSWSSEMRDLEFGEGQFLLAFSSEIVTEMD